MRDHSVIAIVGFLLIGTLQLLHATAQEPKESPEPVRGFAEALEEVRGTIRRGVFAEAQAQARDLLALAERDYGPDSVEAAYVLDVLVEALWRGGKSHVPETKQLIDRAVAIKEKVLGPDHPEVANSLNRSGTLQVSLGNFSLAQVIFERVVSIREQTLGRDSPEVAKVLNNLAVTHFERGAFEKARDLYQRALTIYENAPGTDEIVVARSLNNLGNALYKIGDYSASLMVLERARETYARVSDPASIEASRPLANLANIHFEIGDFSQAIDLYEVALENNRKALGNESPEVPYILHNLGVLYYEQGDLQKAESLLKEALGLYERTLDLQNPAAARSMETLAKVRMARGDPKDARPLLEQSLAIRVGRLGADHPEVAENRQNLAVYFRFAGDEGRARELLQQARAIYESALGARHPLVGKCLVDLAQALAAGNETAEALHASLRAEEIAREHLRLTARTLTERQALGYASARTRGLDLALTLAGDGLAASDRQRIWDSLIRSRALVLDEVASRHRLVRGAADIGRLAREMFAANQRLANLTVRGTGEDSPETYRRLLEAARRERDAAERSLAEKSVAFQQMQARAPIGAPEVASALPARTALVSFVRYDRYPLPSGREASPRQLLRPAPAYVSVVFRKGQAAPRFIQLGAAEEIDALVSRWREEVVRGPLLPGRSGAEVDSAYLAAAAALHQKVWAPVMSHLEGTTLVLVVPDGALHLVNFSALPGNKGHFLLEKSPPVHYLSSEKDLVPPVESGVRGRGLLALGGPAFDDPRLFARLTPAGEGRAPRGQPASGVAFRGERSGCGDFRSVQFAPLPAAVREVDEISALWRRASDAAAPAGSRDSGDAVAGVIRLTGPGADEASFKETAAGKKVLHLATHAFFLGERCASALDATRGIGGITTAQETGPRPVAGENPLLLAGLALAGANHREAAAADEEDGILTAEEIAALDLTGVEWAVLSACDTGVGEVKAGEGVLGMRRAFQVAGARTLIMSLWSVDDEAARTWMRHLYEARLLRKAGTAEVVQRASLEALRARRAKGESTHPFYWAAFVAAGEWR